MPFKEFNPIFDVNQYPVLGPLDLPHLSKMQNNPKPYTVVKERPGFPF